MNKKTVKNTNQKGAGKKCLFIFIFTIIFSVAAVGSGLVLNISSAAEPMDDPLTGIIFALQIDGAITGGYFTEVTGIGSSSEVVEHKVVDENGNEIIQKIPGRLIFNNVTLKRGITSNKDMWDWRKQVEDGNISTAKVNCNIVAYDQAMTPIAQWDLADVWPSQITQLISDDGFVEEIVIVCQSEERVQ